MMVRKEGNVLFNDALNTFYLRLYGVTHMVKDHSDMMSRYCWQNDKAYLDFSPFIVTSASIGGITEETEGHDTLNFEEWVTGSPCWIFYKYIVRPSSWLHLPTCVCRTRILKFNIVSNYTCLYSVRTFCVTSYCRSRSSQCSTTGVMIGRSVL